MNTSRTQRSEKSGYFILRALHPSRKRSVPLAAPRPVDTQDHAWDKRTWSREHWRPCRCSPPVQERRPMHVLYPGDENEKCTRSVAMTSNVKGREQLFSHSV